MTKNYNDDPEELSETGLLREAAENWPNVDYDSDPESDIGQIDSIPDGYTIKNGNIEENDDLYLSGGYFERLISIDKTRFILKNRLGTDPTSAEIAQELGVEEFEVNAANLFPNKLPLNNVQDFDEEIQQLIELIESWINTRAGHLKPVYSAVGTESYYDFFTHLTDVEDLTFRALNGLIDGRRKDALEIMQALGVSYDQVQEAAKSANHALNKYRNSFQDDDDDDDDESVRRSKDIEDLMNGDQ